MINFIIGIDPGNTGALALMDTQYRLWGVWDIPTVAVKAGKNVKERISAPLLWNLWTTDVLKHATAAVVYLERLVAMPPRTTAKKGAGEVAANMSGAVSMLNFGRGGGLLEMAAAASGLELREVMPAQWKRAASLSDDKDASRAKVLQLYPTMAEQFKRKMDHNRAEAVMIARYGVFDVLKQGGAR